MGGENKLIHIHSIAIKAFLLDMIKMYDGLKVENKRKHEKVRGRQENEQSVRYSMFTCQIKTFWKHHSLN